MTLVLFQSAYAINHRFDWQPVQAPLAQKGRTLAALRAEYDGVYDLLVFSEGGSLQDSGPIIEWSVTQDGREWISGPPPEQSTYMWAPCSATRLGQLRTMAGSRYEIEAHTGALSPKRSSSPGSLR